MRDYPLSWTGADIIKPPQKYPLIERTYSLYEHSALPILFLNFAVLTASISETMHKAAEAFERHGEKGLFVLAILESSFLPVPPDFVMIALAYQFPEKSYLYATICLVGSLIGATINWHIGRYGGEPIARRIFGAEKLEHGKVVLRKYDVWGMAIAGFTPIPYMVFAMASGIIEMPYWKMIFVSFFARGGRFFLVGTFFYFLGPKAKDWIEHNFNFLTIIIMLIIIIAVVVYAMVIKKRKRDRSKGER